ncbi:MAG: guanylate kinase [Isosphaeraceae bacterium]|nr:guanylate kinase [Isosphaeraceae bacterium]
MYVEGRGYLPGKLVVVSGPSGSGKSTLIRLALERLGSAARLSVSATTRPPREGERDGVDYFFTDKADFIARSDRDYLEWAEYNGHYYGTPAAPVYDVLALGGCVLLEIEVQGALQIRRVAPEALFVFVKAPDFAELARRLRARGTEPDPVVLRRLRIAREELAEAHWYDAQIINDDLDSSVEEFTALLKSYGCGG